MRSVGVLFISSPIAFVDRIESSDTVNENNWPLRKDESHMSYSSHQLVSMCTDQGSLIARTSG